MGDERLNQKVYMSEVSGERGTGRPRFRWIDGVKDTCEERGMSLATTRWRYRNQSEWRYVTDEIL